LGVRLYVWSVLTVLYVRTKGGGIFGEECEGKCLACSLPRG
jgi:hypothetical protein